MTEPISILDTELDLTDRHICRMAEQNHVPTETWTEVLIDATTGNVIFSPDQVDIMNVKVDTALVVTVRCARDKLGWPCPTRKALDAMSKPPEWVLRQTNA